MAALANHEIERLTGREGALTAKSISDLECGLYTWPRKATRDALCLVLGANDPSELGFHAFRRSGTARPSSQVPDTSSAGRPPRPDEPVDLDGDVKEVARFAHQVASNAVHELTLEQIHADVRQLAYRYVSEPLGILVHDLRTLRHDVFNLIEHNRFPKQIRQLHLAASRLCGLQAHVCLDLGLYHHADTIARAALLSGDAAGQRGMRGWVRALQSLIAYWDGRYDDAIQLARDGVPFAIDAATASRLPALQARAAAARGDVNTALSALEEAEQSRSTSLNQPELDGVFQFPAAKQAAYAGTTLLSLREPKYYRRAVTESRRAVAIYQSAPPDERSTGDFLAARLDLATAYLFNDDLDAVQQELSPVLAARPEQRTASIQRRAKTLAYRLQAPRFTSAAAAVDMSDALAAFCVKQPARPLLTEISK